MLLARLWYLICTFSFSCHFGGKCALLILSEFYCSWVFYSQNKNKLERRMKWERIGISTALTLGRTENVTIAVSFTNSLLQLATINGKNSSECPSDSCRVITVQSSNSILTKSDTQQSVTLMCLRFRNGNENIFFNDRGCFPESKKKDEKHGEIRVWYAQSWGCWLFMLWTIEHFLTTSIIKIYKLSQPKDHTVTLGCTGVEKQTVESWIGLLGPLNSTLLKQSGIIWTERRTKIQRRVFSVL